MDDKLANAKSTPAPVSEITGAAQFLLDRLEDFERGSLSDDLDDAVRDFSGHVSPAIERLRAALTAAEGGSVGHPA